MPRSDSPTSYINVSNHPSLTIPTLPQRPHQLEHDVRQYPGADSNVGQGPRDASARASLRVFIVDGDSMSSDLLAGVLAKDAYFACEVVQSAQLLQSLEAAKADLVVITVDANSNPGQSFALANSVRLACPSVNIVCLLNQITSAFVIKAFRSGACGVCARKRSLSEFIDCLKRVAQGCIWAGPWETAALLQAFMLIPAPDIALGCNAQELTERELQVVQCASKGMTNKAIAGELRLSEHTVKNYLFKAFEKLGVSSRVELLFYLTTRQKVNELATDDDSDAVYNTEAAG